MTELPTCIYCGEPADGYVISAGNGVAHEDACSTSDLCECGHDAEDHYGKGLSCEAAPVGGVGPAPECPCAAWKPHHEGCDIFDTDPAVGRNLKPCNCPRGASRG